MKEKIQIVIDGNRAIEQGYFEEKAYSGNFTKRTKREFSEILLPEEIQNKIKDLGIHYFQFQDNVLHNAYVIDDKTIELID